MDKLDVTRAWDELLNRGISEQTLRVVTNINGYTLKSLEEVLYSEFGYRTFDQLLEDE